MSNWVHIYPVNDMVGHDLDSHDGDDLCWCHPEIDWDDQIVIHSSMDGRGHNE